MLYALEKGYKVAPIKKTNFEQTAINMTLSQARRELQGNSESYARVYDVVNLPNTFKLRIIIAFPNKSKQKVLCDVVDELVEKYNLKNS